MMEGRPRSAVRTASAAAVVSASTEFLERGAMVGAGQYGVPKKASFGANALSPLVLPQQPAATSPLTSPAPPTPDPPTATAADLHAMVIALDESRDFHSASPAPSPGPTAPASPSPLSSHSPDPSNPPSPGPLASSSPTLDLEPTPGSLKLFCSGTVGEIIRSPSPGPRPGSGSRASLTLIPRGIRANSPSTNTPTARHGAGAFPLSIDVGTTATAAAHSGGSSPQRQQCWLESVYSPKSPSTGRSGPGSGSPLGAGKGMMAPDVPQAVRSPMGSPGRQRGSGTPAVVMSTSSSSPGRTGVSRAATSLQHVYGPMPPPPPVIVVASADADWSHTGGGEGGGDGAAVANGSSSNGDTAASDPLPVKEGLRAYYLLSPPSPSAVVKSAMGSPGRGSNPGGSAERSGSPRRGAPVGATAATLPQKFPSMSAAHRAATSSPGRQPVAVPATPIAQASHADAVSDAAMSNGSLVTGASSPENMRQPPAPAASRSDGGHVERPAVPAVGLGQGPVPGPGPGSAAVAAGRVSPAAVRVSTAWSGRGRSPYGAASAAAQGTGPFRSQASASIGSPAGSPPPPTSQQQQGSDRRATRREELFEEQDPEVVLEQSIALLSEIEGHIRESVGLQPDHPLQSIDPDLAQDIPLQLVEALEDTLEVIAMAREELARNRVGDPGQDRSRDRERDGNRDRDRDRGPRQPSHGPGTSLSPYAQYRSIGGSSSAGGARGRVSRTGSQPGNGLSSGGGGSAGGFFSGTSRPPRGSWAGGGGPSSSSGGAGPTHGGSPGSHLPPIGGSSSSGGGAGGGRSGASLYGRPPNQQHSSRPSSRQQHPQPQTQPPQPPRSSSISRRTSGSLSSGGGAGAGGGSMTSIPSLAATISSRRAWHREPPPEEWVAAKQARADSERRKREAQLAADLRYLQQIRGRASEVQQTHEALLAQAEESVRAARSAKASTEAQHRWLQYQDTVTEGAKRHYENLMAQQHGAAHAHDGACGPTRYRVY